MNITYFLLALVLLIYNIYIVPPVYAAIYNMKAAQHSQHSCNTVQYRRIMGALLAEFTFKKGEGSGTKHKSHGGVG